jgi:hypothetical protein
MQPTLQFACLNFYTLRLPDKLELLMAQREQLFAQEQLLLARQTELTRQQQELCTQRTIHELRCHLFWLKLRNPVSAKQGEEAETTSPLSLTATP